VFQEIILIGLLLCGNKINAILFPSFYGLFGGLVAICKNLVLRLQINVFSEKTLMQLLEQSVNQSKTPAFLEIFLTCITGEKIIQGRAGLPPVSTKASK
jgi:hypothetical protein